MKKPRLISMLFQQGFKRPIQAQYFRPDGSVFLAVKNEPDAAEMVIDGAIGESWYDSSGTTSKQFCEALANIPKGRKIHVKINSEGGAIGDALAIHNALKERGQDVRCTITGYALSSATIVCLGANKLHAPDSSIMMIHEPWSMTMGDASEHEKAAEMLHTHGECIAGIYADKTGKSLAECRKMMEEETWFTGAEAREHGFADDPPDEDLDNDDYETQAAARVAQLDISKFKNVSAGVMNMIKPKISTAAISGGGTGPDSRIVLNNQYMTTAANAPAPAPVAAPVTPPAPVAAPETLTISRSELDSIRTALDRERRARIEGRIDTFIAECRLTNQEREAALNRALNDETYLDELAQRPPIVEAGRPPGPGYDLETVGPITGVGNVWDRIRDLKPEGSPHNVGGLAVNAAFSRNQFRRANWSELIQQAMAMDTRGTRGARFASPATSMNGERRLPVAANTYSSTLVVDFLADAAITQLVATLAPLRVFVRDFMPSPFMPLNTLQVRLVTTSSAAQTQGKEGGSTITNYESGDNTVSPVSITMLEYSQAFHVNAQELMSGLRIEFLAQHNLMTLGNNMQGVALAILRSGNSTTGFQSGSTVDAHTGNFQWNSASSAVPDMATLRGTIGKSPIKNAILDPAYFSKLITIPVATPGIQIGVPHSSNVIMDTFGWNEIAETTAFPATMGVAGSDTTPIAGAALNPQAIAVGARLPILPPEGIPGNTLVQSQVTIPGMDITIAIFHWFSLSSRTLWNSFGLVFGAAAGDLTAARVLRYAGA